MNNNSNKKYKVLKTLATILKISGGLPFSACYSGIGSILMMHRVVPESKKDRIWANAHLEITPEHLESAVKYYKKQKYHFASLDELHHILINKEKIKHRLVVFSFDDGYKDNVQYAYPVLKKHKVPFAIYVITDFPDQKTILWWDVLENEIMKKDKISFDWYGEKYHYQCVTYEEKVNAFESIHALIQSGSQEDINSRAKKFCDITGNNPFEMVEKLALNWNDIQQLSEDPLVTIGSHTISHAVLKNLSDKESYKELKISKDILENRITKKIEHISYPFGGHEHSFLREYDFASGIGYKIGTTTVSAPVFKEHKNRLLYLPRVEYGSTMNNNTLDLNRFGLLNFLRNKGIRIN